MFSRNYVCFKSIMWESKSVKNSVTAPWTETPLLLVFTKYELKYLFNKDEFVWIFFQCLTDKKFSLGSGKRSGDKKNKICIIRRAASNALGQKLEKFLIGKSSSSSCLENIKKFLAATRAKNQSWMMRAFFEESF